MGPKLTTAIAIASFALSCLAFYFSALRRMSRAQVFIGRHDINSHVDSNMHIIGIQCSVFNQGNTPILLERADLVIDFIGPEGPWHFSLDNPIDKVIAPFSIETFWHKFQFPKKLFGLILPPKGNVPTRIQFRLKNYRGLTLMGSLVAVIFKEVGPTQVEGGVIDAVKDYGFSPAELLFNWRPWHRNPRTIVNITKAFPVSAKDA